MTLIRGSYTYVFIVDGDLTLDMVRDFLREDESREGRALLAKLVEHRFQEGEGKFQGVVQRGQRAGTMKPEVA